MDRKYRHAERVIRQDLTMSGKGVAEGGRIYFYRATSMSSVKITMGIMSSMV
jgi:hypothetical protein